MFGKFLSNDLCMRTVNWLLDRPDGEYSATIISIECNAPDVSVFVATLSVLEGVGIIKVNTGVEELMVSLNKEASITQLFLHLKEEFNDVAYRSETVSPALSFLAQVSSDRQTNILGEEELNKIVLDKKELNDICELVKNYKDLDLSDPMNFEIYKICTQLEANDGYEDFVKHLEGRK